MSTTTRPVGILLRLNAKSFEPINAIRARYPVEPHPKNKTHPQDPLMPVLTLFKKMPRSFLPTMQAKLSKLAAARKPLTINLGGPVLYEREEIHKYGIGFALGEEVQQLRHEIYKELSEDIKEAHPEQSLTRYKFRPDSAQWLSIRNSTVGFSKERGVEVLAELKREYPNGFGSIVAEGLAIQDLISNRFMIVTEERMMGEYPFGAN